MSALVRIGMDTSKSLFQIHGVDENEAVVVRRQLKREEMSAYFQNCPKTLIAIESCASSQHWGRLLMSMGHHVKLIHPKYVKAYVKRGKNDAADAEALCEAVSRPGMRFVPIKSPEQQAGCMLIRVRERLTAVKVQLSNAFRGHAAEFGIVGGRGSRDMNALIAEVLAARSLPKLARDLFRMQVKEYQAVVRRLHQINAELLKWHRTNELSQRLATIPGIGPIGAAMLSLRAPPASTFKCGRQFAAWLGLTPKDHSSGGRQRLGRITKAGDAAIRSALVLGSIGIIAHVRKGRIKASPWLAGLLGRKPPKLVAVALANKSARVAWRLMMAGGVYNPEQSQTAA